MLIEVTETHPPQAGKKVAHVVAKDGQKFEIWPDKLAGIQIGRPYEVAVEEREYNGRTFRKITKAVPVNGSAHPVTNGNGSVPVTSSAPSVAEAEFVGRALHALILKGEVAYTKQALYEATQALRGLYGATFGR